MKNSVFRVLVAFAGLAFSNTACSQKNLTGDAYALVPYYRSSVTDIVTLKVPKGYLDTYVMQGPRVDGAKEYSAPIFDALYLEMSAADFSPRGVDNESVFRYPGSLTQKISLMVTSYYKRTEAGSTAARRELANFRERDFFASCKQRPDAQQKFGLEWYAFDRQTCPYRVGLVVDRLVLRDAEGHVTTELECNPVHMPIDADRTTNSDGRAINPQCKHIYFLKELNAVVTLDYSTSHLQNWREIEAQTRKILMSFVDSTN